MKITYEKNMRYPAVKASVAMKSSIFLKNVSLSFFLNSDRIYFSVMYWK